VKLKEKKGRKSLGPIDGCVPPSQGKKSYRKVKSEDMNLVLTVYSSEVNFRGN
jgi:hypothetical protein